MFEEFSYKIDETVYVAVNQGDTNNEQFVWGVVAIYSQDNKKNIGYFADCFPPSENTLRDFLNFKEKPFKFYFH